MKARTIMVRNHEHSNCKGRKRGSRNHRSSNYVGRNLSEAGSKKQGSWKDH